MEREQRQHNERLALLTAIAGVVVLGGLSQFAFTQSQKDWIRERDNNKCNFPGHHRCNGRHQLQVHHVMPQRYCSELGIDPDFAENGITICEHSHQTMIHPDMQEAKSKYPENHDSYKEVFSARKEKLQQRQIYWNDKWDRAMQATVYRNQQRFTKSGAKPFPQKKH